MIKSTLKDKKDTNLNNTKTSISSTTSSKKSTQEIDKLQDNLMKALEGVFDGGMMSDDKLLAYGDEFNYDKPPENNYKALTEKAKIHLTKSKVQLGIDPSKPFPKVAKKQPDTFVTYLEMDGKLKDKTKEDDDDDPEELEGDENMGNIGDVFDIQPMDDLEELRRMIKKTKKSLKAYGNEVSSLKSSVSDLNDYACDLGYGVDPIVLSSMDSKLYELKGKNKKNASVKTLNSSEQKMAMQLAKMSTSKMSTTSNISTTSKMSTTSKVSEDNKLPSSTKPPMRSASLRIASGGGSKATPAIGRTKII